MLRSSAHLAANKYGQPILGLIFLRYADILFKQHEEEINAEFNRLSGTRMEKTKKEIVDEWVVCKAKLTFTDEKEPDKFFEVEYNEI